MNVDAIMNWERLGSVPGSDLAAAADELRRAAGISALADGADAASWLEWLTQFASSAPHAELTSWYANADRMLSGLKRKATYSSPVRVEPGSLDIVVRVYLDHDEVGEDARSIRVGMAPGDKACAEPCWFVAPHPAPTCTPGSLAAGGTWRTEGGPCAVLPASALVTSDDPQEQPGQVINFLQSAINAAWAALAAEHGS